MLGTYKLVGLLIGWSVANFLFFSFSFVITKGAASGRSVQVQETNIGYYIKELFSMCLQNQTFIQILIDQKICAETLMKKDCRVLK